MEDLNMDILDLIYKELVELKDQLNLAAVHPNLSEAFAYHNRRRFKEIYFQEYENLEQKYIHLILQHCGRNVKALHDYGHEKSVEMLQLALQYCPYLENVTVFITPSNLNQIEKIVIKLQTLKAIEIRRQNNVPNINDLVTCLPRFTHIRKIKLYNVISTLNIKDTVSIICNNL